MFSAFIGPEDTPQSEILALEFSLEPFAFIPHTVKLGYSNIGFCDTLSIASNIINIVILII
jgi:hypothetical protein